MAFAATLSYPRVLPEMNRRQGGNVASEITMAGRPQRDEHPGALSQHPLVSIPREDPQ